MAAGPESGVHRTFYQLPAADGAESGPGRPADPTALLHYVRQQTIGRDRSFLGPFGPNRAVYCDHTASGKSLRFIEDYIRDEVLPTYANTHTTSTHSALQTTSFRDEARLIVRNSVQASEHDAVLFCGSGATAAVHKLIGLLALQRPPLVLVGPYEHHSSLLPWREAAAEVVRVPEDPVTGGVSLPDLEAQLIRLAGSDRTLVACFSAASNVTGLVTSDAELTAVVHRHGGLVVWDYATAGPYTKIAMNPVVAGLDAGLTQKDALFFSPHKLIGGVQTPGVLVVKKRLVRNKVPDGGGGGTVFFVRRQHHRYLQDVEAREEGGTPGIVESIRAGLVLQLKEALGPDHIRLWDDAIVSRFLREVRSMPHLVLLGPRASPCPRLPIFSFLVATPSGAFLHHNFVAALLNDLFGVQSRGGCACAGPYAQDLLGIDEQLAARYEHVLIEDSRLDRTHLRRQGEYSSYELLRPGFTRVTLSYLLTEDELEHVTTALRLVSEEGWKLLPQYRVNPETGEWRHHSNMVLKERRWLGDIRYTAGRMEYRQRTSHPPAPDLHGCQARARAHIANARKNCPRQLADHRVMFDASVAELRWFLLPNEAKLMLHGTPVTLSPPFKPRVYSGQSRPALGRRRALSESREPPASARPSRHGADGPPSPATPPQPAAAGAVSAQYAGSLDRERGRPTRAPPAAATTPPAAAPRSAHLKQRAMSVSCGTDRRLSDTRFLAQELHNLFFSGARAGAALRRHGSAGQMPAASPPARPVSGDRRSSPDGAESRPPAAAEAVPAAPHRSSSAAAALAGSPGRRVVAVSVVAQRPPAPVAFSLSVESDPGSVDAAAKPGGGGPAADDGKSDDVFDRPAAGSGPAEVADSCTRDVGDKSQVASKDGGETENTDDTQAAGSDGKPSVGDSSECAILDGGETKSQVSGSDSSESQSLDRDGAKVSAVSDTKTNGASAPKPSAKGVPARDVNESKVADASKLAAVGAAAAKISDGYEADVSDNNQPEGGVDGEPGDSDGGEAKIKQSPPAAVEGAAPAKPAGPAWHSPPRPIFKKAAEAIEEFSMLRPDDRVLVCLSGGKDSLSLLHVLRQYQFVSASRGAPFQLAAVTVDPQSSAYDPRPLVPYLAKLGVPYFYEVQGILQQAEQVDCSSICSFCSRMKRGRLYAAARRQGYNVLAFGQHLDDISESFLMSVFHNGRLRTMKACYAVAEKDLRVIRPLIYVREKELRQFAESRRLPVIPENCPACFEEPKERHRVKQLLAQQEVLFPHLFESLRSALRPLYVIDRTGLESRLFGRAGADADHDDDDDDDDEPCGGGDRMRCPDSAAA